MAELRHALWIAAALLVAGCAQEGEFPSLKPRPIESAAPAPPPVAEAPPEPAAADPGVIERVTELTTQAQQGEEAFRSALDRARASVGRAGASGSDSWIEAQQDVSALHAARAPTIEALAALDRLPLERTQVGLSVTEADSAAIAAAAAQIRQLSEGQQQELDALSRQLEPL